MTKDWSGLTGDEMAEKLAEALNPFAETWDYAVNGDIWENGWGLESFRQCLKPSDLTRARAALASYRAAVVPVLTAEAMPEDDGWRPIETAPKDDGRDGLLVWHAPHVELAVRRGGEWYVANYPDGAILSPTHWMPLPAPPVAKEPR